MKDKSFDLEINKMIYQFKIELDDISKIEFRYDKIFTYENCSLEKQDLKLIFKNLLSLKNDFNYNLENKSLIIEQIEDHMQFIDVILFSSQIDKALYQLASILWNNLWIFKNNDYFELKVKDFLVKLFDKHKISKYLYFLIFNYVSKKEINESELKEIDFDNNIDDIDYELDNINYSEYKTDSDLSLDFLFD